MAPCGKSTPPNISAFAAGAPQHSAAMTAAARTQNRDPDRTMDMVGAPSELLLDGRCRVPHPAGEATSPIVLSATPRGAGRRPAGQGLRATRQGRLTFPAADIIARGGCYCVAVS